MPGVFIHAATVNRIWELIQAQLSSQGQTKKVFFSLDWFFTVVYYIATETILLAR